MIRVKKNLKLQFGNFQIYFCCRLPSYPGQVRKYIVSFCNLTVSFCNLQMYPQVTNFAIDFMLGAPVPGINLR